MSYTCPKCGRTSFHPRDGEERYCGRCHAYLDQLLAFRVYVADDLMAEHWYVAGVDRVEPRLPEGHAALCRRAEAAGLTWRLEIHDPSSGVAVRLGGDDRGMVDRLPVDLEDVDAVVRLLADRLGYTDG